MRPEFDNPYSPHAFSIVSPLDAGLARNVLADRSGATLTIRDRRWNVAVRVRDDRVHVIVDRGVVGDPRIRVFQGSIEPRSDTAGCILSGHFVIAGVVRFFLIPLIVLFLLLLVVASFYAWFPLAPFAVLWAWGLGTFFVRGLAFGTPAVVEASTSEWLLAILS